MTVLCVNNLLISRIYFKSQKLNFRTTFDTLSNVQIQHVLFQHISVFVGFENLMEQNIKNTALLYQM